MTEESKNQPIEDIYQNYDSVFKDAITLFKGKKLKLEGMPDLPEVLEPLGTEHKEVHVETEFSDLTFKLADGRGLHMEWEVDISQKDLLRFCGYQIDLTQRYGIEFLTVIFTKEAPSVRRLAYETLEYKPHIVDCIAQDAEEVVERISRSIREGEPVNELEIIYLPMFKSRYTPTELLDIGVTLLRELPESEVSKEKILALMLVASNKLVDEARLAQIWEENKMMKLKIFDVIEESGRKKGLTDIVRYMLNKNHSPEEIKSMTGVTDEIIEAAKKEALSIAN